MRRVVQTFGPARWATVAAVALSASLGLFHALAMAPWGPKDERAHTGYALVLVDGALPELSTPIEVPRGAPALRWTMEQERTFRTARGEDERDSVWVANHPPGGYLPALPGVWLGDHLGRGDIVLLSMRLTNVMGAALTVLFTGFLARDLTGRGSLGALAAGLCAALPYFGAITAQALTDGLATASVVGALWLTLRAVRRGFDPQSVALLAGVVAVTGLLRLSAMITALAIVGAGLVMCSLKAGRPQWRPAVWIGAATLVSSGWFYARNVVLYGDPAASHALLARFDRVPYGPFADTVTDMWLNWKMVRSLTGGRLQERMYVADARWWEPSSAVALVAVCVTLLSAVLLAGHLLTARSGGSATSGATVRSAHAMRDAAGGAGWLLVLVAVVTTWILAARHVSGGGSQHARYLLVAVPAAACVVAAGWGGVVASSRSPQHRTRGIVLAMLPVVALLGVNLAGLRRAVADQLVADWTPFGSVRLGPGWSLWMAGLGVAVFAPMYLAALWRALGSAPDDVAGSSRRSETRPVGGRADRSRLR